MFDFRQILYLHRSSGCVALWSIVATMAVIGASAAPMRAQGKDVASESWVAHGWHPWYELKADPEDPNSAILCGMKWDDRVNAFFGFVYASSDGGKTWRSTLEDRNSAWVSEQSCAFGPHHMAYFVSEASLVVDGETNHPLGTTRLYVSKDGGQHWAETGKTAWADHSASAISLPSGRLYTFFNFRRAAEQDKKRTGNAGLLVFSPDGSRISGPFLDTGTESRGYAVVYPFYAITLKSGAVVCLYHGVFPGATEQDLVIVRTDDSEEPRFESKVVSHTVLGNGCRGFDHGALAYDLQRGRLFVIYGDGCDRRQVMLTTSDDEGRTWTRGAPIWGSKEGRAMVAPSVAVEADGALALLWEEGWRSGHWLLSTIRNQKLEPPTELSPGLTKLELSNDALESSVIQPSGRQEVSTSNPSEALIGWVVASGLNTVWRISGLVTSGEQTLAVWPTADRSGTRLHAAIFPSAEFAKKQRRPGEGAERTGTDVTRETVLLSDGPLRFDNASGTLKACLSLGNRGEAPLRVPITLEAREIQSPLGDVFIREASNGVSGMGAVWDISNAVTGNQLPPHANSNPFCLSFGFKSASNYEPNVSGLLNLRLKVFASR